jgi:ADP-ribose pyrophosphatase YjhB (NUDIX family)
MDERELKKLALAYGQPEMRIIEVEGDEYLFSSRLYRSRDRRGEVVMAIERPQRCVLLHRKGWYEPGVYRLLTGGIDLGEAVETTLIRELEEETGLTMHTTRFLGVLDCRIHYREQELSFVSYVFHLLRTEGALRLRRTAEDISGFRDVPIVDLPSVAEDLRHVPPPRTGWGHWRAIAHDFVHERLCAVAAGRNCVKLWDGNTPAGRYDANPGEPPDGVGEMGSEMSPQEVEAKFIVPDDMKLQQLLDMRELAGFRLEPRPTVQVSDSYRDTADRAIYRGGYACRIRRKGDKRVATLKGRDGAEGAVHARAEHEVTLESESWQLAETPRDWPASPARELALALSQGEPLMELFSLSQQRHTRTVYASRFAPQGDRLVAELSLDVVEMHIGVGAKVTFEVEVELAPEGTLEDLALMVADLRDKWQLQPQPRSKFEQGLAALNGGRLARDSERYSV